MKTVLSSGVRVAYDDMGHGDRALVCFPGWCNRRVFMAPLAEALSAKHRVINIDWPGHGDSETPDGDFGTQDLVKHALAVLDDARVQRFVPISMVNAGWVSLDLARQVPARMDGMVFISWPLFEVNNVMKAGLEMLQDPAEWMDGRDGMFSVWFHEAAPELDAFARREMGSFDFEMWSRAGREISTYFEREGSPLAAMASLQPPLPVLHVYGRPNFPGFLEQQQAFAAQNSWFHVHRLATPYHFPSYEAPEEVATVIDGFLNNHLRIETH